MSPRPNPFAVTAAVDFTDREIIQKWVDFPGEGGVQAMAKPASEMPMVILGGKGSGKTHLMRYLAAGVRLSGGSTPSAVLASGFIGTYLRCGGINAARFQGKGRTDDEWFTVFQYHFDLVLAELLLRDVARLLRDGDMDVPGEQEAAACAAIVGVFEIWRGPMPERFTVLADAIARLRRDVDVQVNNCALRKELSVSVDVTPGALAVALPRCISNSISVFSSIRFVYLIDEFENLSERQQVYINSLVRENAPPACIKVGARLYGLRTYATLSAGEELKAGSEYEPLVLDEYFRSKGDKKFAEFATNMCAARLRDAGFRLPSGDNDIPGWMRQQFEALPESALRDEEVEFALRDESPGRPWMRALRRDLERLMPERSIREVLEALAFYEHPLVERVAVHAFYQQWFKSRPTVDGAIRIREEVLEFLADPLHARSDGFKQTFGHWKTDMLAHVYKAYKRPLFHGGFDRLVDLAHGLPRHLLVILKHVYSWSLFRDERPFDGGTISTEAQRLGVNDAAEWFFHDARMAGPDGEKLKATVSRICEFLKEIRFSDKPAETGICTFSVDMHEVAPETRRILELAEKWSLLGAKGGGRPDRNSARVDEKFRVNPLLCVRYSLSSVVRGDLAITARDMDAIVTGSREEYDAVVSTRVANMTAANFGRRVSPDKDVATLPLFGPGKSDK